MASSWRERASKVGVGDTVRYAADWLRSTGQTTGAIAQARGTVTALEPLGRDLVLATIDWGGGDWPARVNVKNLARVPGRGLREP